MSAVSGSWTGRCLSSTLRSEAFSAMEPARCGGKPGRGNGNHRHGGGGEGSARWLHAALLLRADEVIE